MSSATLSIRLPIETHRWLERFAKRRGSAGMAATRILEESKRREEFSALDFRDTPVGRLAYVQGSMNYKSAYRKTAQRLDRKMPPSWRR